jgi:glycine cleavage system regulatory protein
VAQKESGPDQWFDSATGIAAGTTLYSATSEAAPGAIENERSGRGRSINGRGLMGVDGRGVDDNRNLDDPGGGLGGGGPGGMPNDYGLAAKSPSLTYKNAEAWGYPAEPGVVRYSYRFDVPTAQSPPAEAGAAELDKYFKPQQLSVALATQAQNEPAVAAVAPGLKLDATQQLTEARQLLGRLQATKGEAPAKQQPEAQPDPAAGSATQRKIIRSGQIEFEIDSFDSTIDQITKIVVEEGGFVATVNSEKLPNGKVRGSVVVRVPPERLDTLVLKLRALGDLKSQQIGSQDVGKQYTDLESRLRAARAMEQRLLEMIQTGKGEIKDLLAAEKELGVWRSKIEEFEGELRYYNNQIALSTLTITLSEREIRSPASVTETERIQMGIEVEDVDKAQQAVVQAVSEAGGRISKSELKKHAAEQFSAVIIFEVSGESAGPLRDRLGQIGHVARLDIDRVQQAEGGAGRPHDTRVKQQDTQFSVSLYNLANIAPRETTHVNLACVDAEVAYKTILSRIEQAAGRVVTSSLNRQPNDQTSGSIQFDVLVAEADAMLEAVKAAGEVMRLQVTENPDAQNVTRSKRGFHVQLWAMGTVAPRETTVIQLATRDVPAGYQSLQEAITKAAGRVLGARLNEQDKENITAHLDFEVRREQEHTVAAAMSQVGDIFTRTVSREQNNENVIDSKVRLQVSLVNQAKIPPRETVTLGVEVGDVDRVAEAFAGQVAEGKGRTVESHVAHERNGRVTAKLVFDVPLAAALGLVQKFKAAGTVRAQQSVRNPQVPESELSIARLDVTLSNAELIVPSDAGLWSQIRKGLSTSFVALSWSLIVVIVGVSFTVPWALLLYAGYRIARRIRPKRLATPAG